MKRVIDAGKYWKSGGKLNRDGFEMAKYMRFSLAQGNKPRWVRNGSLAQAEGMAGFSKVPITLEQKYLYAILRETREMIGETEGKSDSSPETPGTMPPWGLTDQLLLAEVIRLTDETNLDSFMRAYPNIFEKTE